VLLQLHDPWTVKQVSSGGAFSRSDWKRQVSGVGGGGVSRWCKDTADAARSWGRTVESVPRYQALLRQITSRDRALRRREFVRQRCRRFGWEPFADTMTALQTLVGMDNDSDLEDHHQQHEAQTDQTCDTQPQPLATGMSFNFNLKHR